MKLSKPKFGSKQKLKGENKNVLKMKLQKLLATRKLPSIFVR